MILERKRLEKKCHIRTPALKSSPSHCCTDASDLKLFRSSRLSPSYLLFNSIVLSSPRAMIASISSLMTKLHWVKRLNAREKKDTHSSEVLIIFSAPCVIISNNSSLFAAAKPPCRINLQTGYYRIELTTHLSQPASSLAE